MFAAWVRGEQGQVTRFSHLQLTHLECGDLARSTTGSSNASSQRPQALGALILAIPASQDDWLDEAWSRKGHRSFVRRRAWLLIVTYLSSQE